MFFLIYYIQTGYNSVYLNCWLFFQVYSVFTQLNVIKLDKHSCGSPLMLFNLWEGPLCHCITPALMAINKLIFWPMSIYQRLLHYYMHHLHEGIGSHSLSIFISPLNTGDCIFHICHAVLLTNPLHTNEHTEISKLSLERWLCIGPHFAESSEKYNTS